MQNEMLNVSIFSSEKKKKKEEKNLSCGYKHFPIRNAI